MHRLILSALCPALLIASSAVAQLAAPSEDTRQPAIAAPDADDGARSRQAVVKSAVGRLVALQHEDGAWPYEGVYRVSGKIPVGYRIGGTSIVCSALISADIEHRESVEDAVIRGTRMILKELEDPLMQPSRKSQYDVRIWGHIYALDYFCRLNKHAGFEQLKSETKPWIAKLAEAVVMQETREGGWNYANKFRHCCFVTAPAIQALLLARNAGVDVADEVLERSRQVLQDSRKSERVYPYTGTVGRRDTPAGSIARGPVCEATLVMLGTGNTDDLQAAINAFHEFWDELEKRRKKTGTHLPPHGIAPYYFYYGHRYASQAIELLPASRQDREFARFEQLLMKTRDDDDTWNDRVFEQSKAYGTAMSLLALSRNSVPVTPSASKQGKQ
jgi:hypothetical protein